MINQLSEVIANKKAQHLSGQSRFWEIDVLRGFAIVQMIFFHFVWDLRFFGLIETNIFQGPWQWFARTIATQFIFWAGVSLTLTYIRDRQKGQTWLYPRYLRRGLTIFGWGLVITVGTIFFIPNSFVIFGILHLIGFAIILGGLFLPLNKWVTLASGIGVILLGIYLDPVVVDYPWLIWLGVKQQGVTMVDYYPAAPWAGIILLGIFAGYTLYPNRRPLFQRSTVWADNPLSRSLGFLGRHSLLIYLVHQPLLIALFYALGYGQ